MGISLIKPALVLHVLHFIGDFLCKTQASPARAEFKRDFFYNQKGRRSIAGMAQALYATPLSSRLPFWLKRKSLLNAARARLARVLSLSLTINIILKEIPFNLTFLHFYQKLNSPSILRGNPFNFFWQNIRNSHTIFFSREITCNFCQKIKTKNWTHLQFYMRNPFKKISDQKKKSHRIIFF